MADSALSESEVVQLRYLKMVYDKPTITAVWRKEECERLVELGLAQASAWGDAVLVSITPAGVEEAVRRGF